MSLNFFKGMHHYVPKFKRHEIIVLWRGPKNLRTVCNFNSCKFGLKNPPNNFVRHVRVFNIINPSTANHHTGDNTENTQPSNFYDEEGPLGDEEYIRLGSKDGFSIRSTRRSDRTQQQPSSQGFRFPPSAYVDSGVRSSARDAAGGDSGG